MKVLQKFNIRKDENIDPSKVAGLVKESYGLHGENAVRGFLHSCKHEKGVFPSIFFLAHDENGDLAGMIRIIGRKIKIDDLVLDAGGISYVAVRPEYRNQGLCSQLMKAAIREITDRRMDISILYARRALDGFYSRYGYRGVGRYIDLKILSAPAQNTSLNMEPFQEKDLDFCARIYDKTYQALAGSFVRDKRHWKYLIGKVNLRPEDLRMFLCRDKNDPVGYLIIQGNNLIELCLPDEHFPGLIYLLNTKGISSISIHPAHPFVKCCRSFLNTAYTQRCPFDGGYMARWQNVESLLQKYLDVWAENNEPKNLSECEVNLLGYKINIKKRNIEKTNEPDDVVCRDAFRMVQLFLGSLEPDQMNGFSFNGKKPWIRSIFPPRNFHTGAIEEI